jgi:GLPGLI family protein
MKKESLFLLLIFSVFNSHSQADSLNIFQIEYEKTLTFEDTKSFTTSYQLQKYIEFEASIFDKISKSKTPNQLVNDDDDDALFYYTPQGENISFVFKNYANSKFYSKHAIAYKYFIVKDSLNIFNWNILDKTKEILGYICQLATMEYRGRNYKAWFAADLPVGGPWKFDGLPGMILSINSDDSFLSFEALKIKSFKIKKTEKLYNPFEIKNAITWDAFKTLYKKKAIALATYNPQEGNSGGMILSRGGIETYIEDDDTDYTADKDLEKSKDN